MADNTTKKQWTAQQLEAITASDKRILVSAAAGSGKTAVLTERIIRKLTDTENPADISRMLIVTFTNAAAAELRDRIGSALASAIAEDPSNRHLSRQYILLSKAKICTIHSFCYDIIRSNFQQLELPADVRIMDENESDLLYGETMEAVLDEYYDADKKSCDIPDFNSFVDSFISIQDSGLGETFNDIYKKLESYSDGIDFLQSCADSLDEAGKKDFSETIWGKCILLETERLAKYYRSIFTQACEYMRNDEKYLKAYYPSFEYEAEFTQNLCSSSLMYDEIGNILAGYSPIKLAPLKAEFQTPETEKYRDARSEFSKAIKKLRERYFTATKDERLFYAEKNAAICRNLYKLLKKYDKRLSDEKRKSGVISFSDLELLCKKLLLNKNGEITDAARSISESYDEIYIDEYQDVNEIQDSIFNAISENASLFMVGDIKQSIYAFRGANPLLFAGYRERRDIRTIFLQNNFRCDEPIVNFSNEIFGILFKYANASMNYVDEDRLIFSKTQTAEPVLPVISVFQKSSSSENGEFSNDEAEYVAEEIQRLLQCGYKPSDIAVLVRSKTSIPAFESALHRMSVPYINPDTADFFENEEILLMLCILNAIDNPRRDIYLAGALKSPVFGFTLDDLVNIRTRFGEGSLYDALIKYTAENDFPKGLYFLNKLDEYRKMAAEMASDRLIWKLFSDTAVFSLIYNRTNEDSEKSKSRRENLILLYEYARTFEAGEYRGLYRFISYLNEAIENKTTFKSSVSAAENAECVKIMTVHSSKGLEFPVCFLCDCDKKFNDEDSKKKLLITKDAGMTIKIPDETGMAKYDTPMRQASALSISLHGREEEMRVLYVALTRAKERLYVTGSVTDDPDDYIMKYKATSEYIGPENTYPLIKAGSYLQWILTAAYHRDIDSICRLNIYKKSTYPYKESESETGAELHCNVSSGINKIAEPEYDESKIKLIENDFRKKFSFVYPYKDSGVLPAKVSVSKLYPELLDEYDTSADIENGDITEKPQITLQKPKFLSENTDAATPTDIGTATHIFMQFCNFEYVDKNGIEAEILRLEDEQFINRSNAELIDREALAVFFGSELYREMKRAKQIWREKRFNVKMPACDFTSNSEFADKLKNEEILVQGVIDCFFIDNSGKLTIVDYKTDSFPDYIKADKGYAERILRQRHSSQLKYYAAACRKLLGIDPHRLLIYSFALGDTVDI